ncbi:MAG: YggT family protein [Candidatus Omnitrophota bacterium]
MIAFQLVRIIAKLFHTAINVYIIIIIVRSVISWMGNVPPNNLIYTLKRMTDPVFRFIHRHLPFTIVGGIDLSPIIVLIALYIIDNVVTNLLMRWADQLI